MPARSDVDGNGIFSLHLKSSIKMLSYNQAEFIEESIQSVLAQNYPDLEFMILDGGSTVGRKQIISRNSNYLAYWNSKPDNDQTDALIRGFDRATGELLGWVNSDYILMPIVFEKIASIYSKETNNGKFFGDYMLIDGLGRILQCKRVPRQRIGWFARHES